MSMKKAIYFSDNLKSIARRMYKKVDIDYIIYGRPFN